MTADITADPVWEDFFQRQQRVDEILSKEEVTVEEKNWLQTCGIIHPFTCGNNRSDVRHTAYAEEHKQDKGLLVATQAGWKCPVCDYAQNY